MKKSLLVLAVLLQSVLPAQISGALVIEKNETWLNVASQGASAKLFSVEPVSLSPVGPPDYFRLKGIGVPNSVFLLEISEDLTNWTEVGYTTIISFSDGSINYAVDANLLPENGKCFFRLRKIVPPRLQISKDSSVTVTAAKNGVKTEVLAATIEAVGAQIFVDSMFIRVHSGSANIAEMSAYLNGRKIADFVQIQQEADLGLGDGHWWATAEPETISQGLFTVRPGTMETVIRIHLVCKALTAEPVQLEIVSVPAVPEFAFWLFSSEVSALSDKVEVIP